MFDSHPFTEVDASNIVDELVFVPVCIRHHFYKSLSCVLSDDLFGYKLLAMQNFFTREVVSAISTSSSHLYRTYLADRIRLSTGTPTPSSCLSTIASRSATSIVPTDGLLIVL